MMVLAKIMAHLNNYFGARQPPSVYEMWLKLLLKSLSNFYRLMFPLLDFDLLGKSRQTIINN